MTLRAPKLGYTWTGQLGHAIRPGDPGERDHLGLRWRLSVCSRSRVLSLNELRAATSLPKFVNNKYTTEHLADLIESAPGMNACDQCRKMMRLGRNYVPEFREITAEMRGSVWADLQEMARQLDDVDGDRRDAWRDLQERAKAARRAQLEALAEADLLAIAAIAAAASDLGRAAALLEAPQHELRAAVMRQWQRDHGVGPLAR